MRTAKNIHIENEKNASCIYGHVIPAVFETVDVVIGRETEGSNPSVPTNFYGPCASYRDNDTNSNNTNGIGRDSTSQWSTNLRAGIPTER